jgi:4-hydroxybenzoate polyprenyltransferase
VKEHIKTVVFFYRIHRVMFILLFAAILMIILARGMPDMGHAVLGLVLFTLALFSVVAVNNIRDVLADKISKKGRMEVLNPLATGKFTSREAWLATVIPLVLGLLIAGLWTNWKVFLLFVGFCVFSSLYNVWGKKFAAGPFISPACLAIFFFLIAVLMGKEDDPALLYVVFIFYIFMVAGQIGTDILDYEGDTAAGYRRPTVIFGPHKAVLIPVFMSAVIPLVLVVAYVDLHLSWLSLFVTAFVFVLVLPISKRFKQHAAERTLLSSKKALGTLTVQYLAAMASLMVGLGIWC